jgi:hypothetical protein
MKNNVSREYSAGWNVRLTTLPPSASRLYRQRGILNIWRVLYYSSPNNQKTADELAPSSSCGILGHGKVQCNYRCLQETVTSSVLPCNCGQSIHPNCSYILGGRPKPEKPQHESSHSRRLQIVYQPASRIKLLTRAEHAKQHSRFDVGPKNFQEASTCALRLYDLRKGNHYRSLGRLNYYNFMENVQR